MEAAQITWRPLGQLFVERGLITQDELEEALVEQQETRKRLGAILVSRGLVSGPELTSVLVDQLGMELTKESGFGSGLWDEIRRRHPRTSGRPDGNSTPRPEAELAAEAPKLAAVTPPKPKPSPAPAAAAPVIDAEKLEEVLAQERAALALAFEEERAELHAALSAERTQLEQELVQARAGAGSRSSELEDLARQVTELRKQVEESTASVAAEQKAVERVKELETGLAAEQAKRQEHADELEFARSEASVEAKELRASLDRIRAELERLDAATSWFEYWSGAVDLTAKD